MSDGKCMHCGGEVGDDGLAKETGSERTPPADNAAGESTQTQDQGEMTRNAERRFVKAVRGSR